ncbi:MAG: GTPase HflX [Chloroflexota bacterium]|nr:GTPase HflX [Chloroflexota bacterium]
MSQNETDRYYYSDQPEETAVLVGIEFKSSPGMFGVADSLAELEQLAETAGIRVLGQTYQRIARPNPATLIGSGKLEELLDMRTTLGATAVLFDEELSPRQQREIEKAIGDEDVKVLDRTALILDIFARHAKTRDGALQVELAQYEYRLPRLTRAWTHLARQAGGGSARGGAGGVGLRGPGETQMEVDRREIGRRIAHLKRELEDVRSHRERHRQRRRSASLNTVSLVGYTNAGKSTLINTLTRVASPQGDGAGVLAEDILFATLDPTTRRIALPSGRETLVSDTVGFIQKLPTTLVAAFRATLEEIAESDLLLHIVDITHPNALQQALTVGEVLRDIGITDKPLITALNKIDLLRDPDDVRESLGDQFPDAIPISAAAGWGMEELLERIEQVLNRNLLPVEVLIPYSVGDLVSLWHTHGLIQEEEHTGEGVRIQGLLPRRLWGRMQPYATKAQ